MKRVLPLIMVLMLLIQLSVLAAGNDNARRYQQAKMLMEIGDYLTAASIFDSLGDYEDSPDMAAKSRQMAGANQSAPSSAPTSDASKATLPPIVQSTTPVQLEKTVQVGDILQFGNYEQDGNTRNGDEPIEWVVLAIQGNKALLLSKYGLDTKPYNTKRAKMTWAESSLRQWLNNDFMFAAFNSAEAERIQTTDVIAEPNPYYPKVPCGQDTKDMVFLLSVNELERYLPYETQRFCLPTQYALDRGAHENSKTGRCRWWLRSPGEDSKHAANVFTSGEYWDDYFKVDSSGLTIRPAMWIIL